ncbi:MAG: CapA family protein [Jiangellales bacterium]
MIASHLTLPTLDLTSAQVRALLNRGVDAGPAPGLGERAAAVVVAPGVDAPPGARVADSAADVLRAVRRDPRTVGLLPADAVDATVRAAHVDSVDPMRSPGDYPLTTPGQPPASVVTISVGGDVMMDRRVGTQLAQTGDFAAPFRGLAERLSGADITVVNLESTLAELGPPTQGIESFVADPRTRSGLRLAGVDVVSLANNHSGDYGPESLLRTIDLLRRGGFAVFGAGADLARADKPAVLVRNGVTVAFVGFNAIGETPPAGPRQPGASSLSMPPRTGPLDQQRLDRITRQVGALADRVDVVVAVPHWGTQYTAVPEPEQSRVGKALLAAGADIVVGGHPHWVQAVERSGDGRLVIHSLGNLVFDMDFSTETMQGVVAELVVWDDRVVAVDYSPYVIGADWVPRWVNPTGGGEQILDRMWQAGTQPFATAE